MKLRDMHIFKLKLTGPWDGMTITSQPTQDIITALLITVGMFTVSVIGSQIGLFCVKCILLMILGPYYSMNVLW